MNKILSAVTLMGINMGLALPVWAFVGGNNADLGIKPSTTAPPINFHDSRPPGCVTPVDSPSDDPPLPPLPPLPHVD